MEKKDLWQVQTLRVPGHSGKLSRLTKEMDDLIPGLVDKWKKIGLSCDPSVMSDVRPAVDKAYSCAGLEPPKDIYIFDSPYSAAIGAHLLLSSDDMSCVAQHLRNQVVGLAFDRKHVEREAFDLLRDEAWSGKCFEIDALVKDRLGDNVGGLAMEHVLSHVLEQSWQVKSRVASEVWRSVGWLVREQSWESLGAWDQVGRDVRNRARDLARHSVLDQVKENVRLKVWDKFCGSATQNLARSSTLENSLLGNSLKNVQDQVWSQAFHQLYDLVPPDVTQERDSLIKCLSDQACGNQDAGWLSMYDFYKKIGVSGLGVLDGLEDVARCCGWWAPYKDVAIVQQRPEKISMYRDNVFPYSGVCHCDGGPAIKYRDGFSVWALNGVRVPQWMAETPAGKIDPDRVLRLGNAQQRAEGIRKIGIERYLGSLRCKVIDSDGDYELLKVRWHDGKSKKFLKMNNPSVPELWHIEGVGNDVKSIYDAMRFRLPERFKHLPFDDDGADWYQQGDVYIVPAGATSIKPRPKILT